MPEQSNNQSAINELTTCFGKAHDRYVHADIDQNFKKEVLLPLRKALNEYKKSETKSYMSFSKESCANLLLCLRSMNLLVEGLYWIGAYKEASRELERFGKLNEIVSIITRKSHKAILTEMSLSATFKGAAPLLRHLASGNIALVDEKNGIIQEMIRAAVHTAMVHYYSDHKYDKASELLETCRTLSTTLMNDDDVAPYGLLAQIDYFTACALRQVNRLGEADKKLRDVLDHYLHRTDHKLEKYQSSNRKEKSRAEFERSAGLSRYRAALTLMVRADLNRRWGKLSIALYANLAVARIILAESSDTINKAYARMLFAIVSREMNSTEKEILDALEQIEKSEEEFARMGHQKYLTRAKYEAAYTLYYLARCYDRNEMPGSVKKVITQALNTLAKLQVGADSRWKGQYLILEGRLLILKNDTNSIERARVKIEEAIKLLSEKVEHRTYLVEALIAKSRVLMEQYVLHPEEGHPHQLLRDAERCLLQAQRENADRYGEPENNKIEAIIDFALARIKTRQGDRAAAKERLQAGSARLPVIDSLGVRRLYETAQRDIDDSPLIFRVSNDLNMKNNVRALQKFILRQAINEQKRRNKKPWEIVDRSRAFYFGLVKEMNYDSK
jgi:hypothetical protein